MWCYLILSGEIISNVFYWCVCVAPLLTYATLLGAILSWRNVWISTPFWHFTFASISSDFFTFFFFYFAEAYKFLHSRLMCEAICRYTSYNCVSQSFRPRSAKRCWFWTLWNHLCKQCPLLEATLLCPIHPFRGRLTYRTYDYSKILCLLFFLLVLLDFWIWILIIPGTMWRCWVRKENRRENWPLHWLGGQAPKPEKPGLSHLWTLVF